MYRWLFLFFVVACKSSPITTWGPQCQTFFAETEKVCAVKEQTYPLFCQGAREGKKRLEDRGPGEDSECRAALESFRRELNEKANNPPTEE